MYVGGENYVIPVLGATLGTKTYKMKTKSQTTWAAAVRVGVAGATLEIWALGAGCSVRAAA
jgi:hypothetical protein